MISIRPIAQRAEWLAWRRRDLTASDIGAVHGCDPHRSARRVYDEKAGEAVPEAETNIMRRGRWLEAAALAALAEEMPDFRLWRPNVYLSDSDLRIGATPDALAEDPTEPDVLVNVQIKVVARPTFERDWIEGPPLAYELQTLTEGMLLDAGRSVIAALVMTTYSADLAVFDVPRHAKAEAGIRQLAATFWKNIAAGVRPATDYERDGDLIEAVKADKAAPPIELNFDNRLGELLPERARLKAVEAATGARLFAIDKEIKDKLGAHERASYPGWQLTWIEEERKGYTVEPGTRRVLKISEEKAA